MTGHDLDRFLKAQEKDYDRALTEIRNGRKQTHWMWYIFPQFSGLGASPTSKHYAIKTLGEAEAYLQHPILGPRLIECVEAVLGVEGRSASAIFGTPDDMKLRSSATLFDLVSQKHSVFDRLLARFYGGERDQLTLDAVRFMIRYLWAAPNTTIGLLFVPIVLMTNGGLQIVGGVMELHCSLISAMLRYCVPLPGGACAITLGHVVLGRDEHSLEITRAHERVHVRQYELWGPFLFPRYFLAAMWGVITRSGAYEGNFFERQAMERE